MYGMVVNAHLACRLGSRLQDIEAVGSGIACARGQPLLFNYFANIVGESKEVDPLTVNNVFGPANSLFLCCPCSDKARFLPGDRK